MEIQSFYETDRVFLKFTVNVSKPGSRASDIMEALSTVAFVTVGPLTLLTLFMKRLSNKYLLLSSP